MRRSSRTSNPRPFLLHAVLLYGFIGFLLIGCVPPQVSHPPDDPAWNDLVAGVRSYEKGGYVDAIRQFHHMIEAYPGSPLLGEAQWLLAKSHHATQERRLAVRGLRDFLRNYPGSAHEEEARALLIQLEQSGQKTIAVYWVPSLQETFEDRVGAFQRRGINTMMVRVFDNTPGRSGLFFKGGAAPLLEDRLGEWIQTAHRAGLRLVVEAPLREMAWATQSHPDWRDRRYDAKRKKLDAIDRLDLFNKEVRRMILQLYRDLSGYPVDGIYIRDIYYGMEEGWTPSALQLYQDRFSETLDPDRVFGAQKSKSAPYPDVPSFWRWVGWRSRFISDFLKEIRREAQSEHPHIEWGLEFPPSLILHPLKGLAEFSGDLLELKQSQFDFYLLTPGSSGPFSLGALLKTFPQYALRPEQVWMRLPTSGVDSFLTAFSKTPLQGLVFLADELK